MRRAILFSRLHFNLLTRYLKWHHVYLLPKDNCNKDTKLVTSTKTVLSCNVGGSISLSATAASSFTNTVCPSSSNSYCMVNKKINSKYGLLVILYDKIILDIYQ